MIKEVLLKKSQEIEYIYLVDYIYCPRDYTVYIILHTYVSANQYINRYFRRDYIQKPLSDFKILYCSWQVYSSDKHLKRTKKTDLIMC